MRTSRNGIDLGLFDYPTDEIEAAALDESPFLDGLSKDDWAKILEVVEKRQFREGENILAVDDSFYILTEGEVEVILEQEGNAAVVLANIPTGSVFGEMAFFDQRPRSASIRAKCSGSAIRFTRANFETLAAWHPVISRKILFDLGRIMSARLRWTTGRMGTNQHRKKAQ
jgi:CRP/FNR family cyclic AMP-dependent transcriptional regulator